uniref:Uncharacterized protein n=1 Tax=Rhizophora mucronata TaxID=61149 RepID=A0A2P2PA58_RHIMU
MVCFPANKNIMELLFCCTSIKRNALWKIKDFTNHNLLSVILFGRLFNVH